MTKESLLMWLREAFSAYPPEEVEERIRFYEEMIDDRMEDGLTEEEAVASLGSLEEVIAKMAAEMPPLKTKKAMRLRWWEILLLVLGFPLWLPLLAAGFAVALSLYICIWTAILCLWAGFVTIAVCSFFGILAGIAYIIFINRLAGVALLGAGIFCMGLSIFAFWGCKVISAGTWKLTVKLLTKKKRSDSGKEGA